MRPELRLAVLSYFLVTFVIPFFVGYAVGTAGVDLGAGFLPVLWVSTFIAGYLIIRSLAERWGVDRPLRLTALAWVGAFLLPTLLSWLGVAVWYWGAKRKPKEAGIK